MQGQSYKTKEQNLKFQQACYYALHFICKKKQPMPYLNTSVVYYKQQLWMYNLEINTRNSNKGFMCLWDETSGKKEVMKLLHQFQHSLIRLISLIMMISTHLVIVVVDKTGIGISFLFYFHIREHPHQVLDTYFHGIWAFIFAQ